MRHWIPALIVAHLSCLCCGESVLQISPARVDLGDIWQGQVVGISVTLTNTGDQPVELGDVRASCSCMNVKLGAAVLKQGESTKLTGQLMEHAPGKFGHRLIVRDKGGKSVAAIVAVVGNARKAYDVLGRWTGEPEAADAAANYHDIAALPSTCLPASLLVRVRGLRPDDPVAKIAESIAIESPVLKIRGAKSLPSDDASVRVDLLCDCAETPAPGSYSFTLKVRIGDVVFSKDCRYRILGDVWTEPKQLNFGVLRGTARKSKDIRINFRNPRMKWGSFEIERTEPAEYAEVVTVGEASAEDISATVSLEIDPVKMPASVTVARGFFSFIAFLRDAEDPKATHPVSGDAGVKLHVYGMIE